MSSKRYPIETVKQITERGHAVVDVSDRIGRTCRVAGLGAGRRQLFGRVRQFLRHRD